MNSLYIGASKRNHGGGSAATRVGSGVALALAFLVLSSTAASAYPLDAGGFTDATDAADIAFQPGTTEITGPSIRLLTNSTISQGFLTIAGTPIFVNSSTQETSSGDFATYTAKDALQISNGQMFLDNDASVIALDASNNFNGAAYNGTVLSAGKVALNGTTFGTFVSANISAPLAGWGSITVAATLGAGLTVTVDLLSPTLSLLVSNQSYPGVISLDPIGNPTVRVRATLSAPSTAATPLLERITLGQRTGDTLIGAGVSRNDSNIVLDAGTDTIGGSTISFTRYPTGPYIANAAGTYYAKYILAQNIIQVNGTWHLFACVNSASTQNNASIGHATSTDFVNWTWDAAPVLERGNLSWQAHHVDHPWVIAEPNGTGYRMYYSGWKTATQMQTGVATSTDLTNWTQYASNPVLAASASGWDSFNTGNGVPAYENGTWKMWYAGTSVTTGGGNSVGYATSSDGYNWTKYAGNPVLSRGGAGTIDRDDFQVSTVRVWNGVYYLLSACNTNAAYHACEATSTDGTSWTKYGNYILNATGSGWEGGHVAFCDFVPNNGRFILLYNAADSLASNWQIGRADANLINGTARGRLDFGARVPSSLSSLTYDAAKSSGNTVEVLLRSSSDAVNWSAFENLTSSSSISTTLPRRYVEWYVYLNASARAEPPVFRGLTLDYRAYRSTGRYASSPIAYPEQVSAAALSITNGSPSGTLTIDVSNDNGSTFLRVTNGVFTNLTLAGNSLIYALNFEATNQQTPVVDAVDIIIQRRGLPENVTVRIGANGTRFFNATGVFNTGVNASLPVGELNAIIAATLAQFPGATSVDVPFVVTSSHYGGVRLSAPRYTQVLKNPLTASFTPAGTALSINENTSTAFSVAASTYPASIKINTTWSKDGVPLPALQDQATYNFSADFFSAGIYAIRCDVENGDFALNHTWTLTVLNVNRLPTFVTLSPGTPLNVSHTATTVFTAVAQDVDLENLTYVWRLDGSLTVSNNTTAVLSNLTLGTHTLVARASDPYSTVSFVWTVISTNAIPTFASVDPPGNFSISHAAARTLSVTVNDADNDTVPCLWLFDGALAKTGSPTFDIANLVLGNHVITAVCSDPFASAVFFWTVTSTNAAPVVVATDPAGDFSLSHTASILVSAVVTDADPEPTTFEWTLDGVPLAATGASTPLSSLAIGLHTLRLLASDEYTNAAVNWTVTSTNAAPAVATLQAPPSDQNRSHNEAVQLDISVGDADGDSLSIAWTVNGVPAGTNAATLSLDPVGHGLITVRASVSDGFVATVWTWNTTGTNAAPLVQPLGAGTSLTVSIVDIALLAVQASDGDGDPLTFRWLVDGGLAGSNLSSFSAGPFAPGSHAVRVTVSDGLLESSALFSVQAVNLPPAFVAFDPAANLTVSHVAVVTVRVGVADHEGDTITYAWALDNATLVSTTNATAVGPLAAGTHLLSVTASDGTNSIRREWRIVSTDLPPLVDGLSPPPGAVGVVTFENKTFTARAFDPEGDAVAMAWFDGNAPVAGTTTVSLRWTTPGVRVVTLEVTAAGFRQTTVWNVTVTSSNAAPRISAVSPNGTSLSMDLTSAIAFAVVLEDDGVLPVTVQWKLDGAVVATGTGFVFRPTSSQIGSHNLTVVVSDTEYALEHNWAVQVSERLPVHEEAGGGTLLFIVGALIGAVAAAVAVAVLVRRRPPPEP